MHGRSDWMQKLDMRPYGTVMSAIFRTPEHRQGTVLLPELNTWTPTMELTNILQSKKVGAKQASQSQANPEGVNSAKKKSVLSKILAYCLSLKVTK